jgi:hypothetical protein
VDRARSPPDSTHRAMPQQAHVIDTVRPGGHPGHQARGLQLAFTPHGREIRT